MLLDGNRLDLQNALRLMGDMCGLRLTEDGAAPSNA